MARFVSCTCNLYFIKSVEYAYSVFCGLSLDNGDDEHSRDDLVAGGV